MSKITGAISNIVNNVRDTVREVGRKVTGQTNAIDDNSERQWSGGSKPQEITRRSTDSGGTTAAPQQATAARSTSRTTGGGSRTTGSVEPISASDVASTVSSSRPRESMTARERAIEDERLAPPVNLVDEKYKSSQIHENAKSEMGKSGKKKGGGKKGGNNQRIQPLSSANLQQIGERTRNELMRANNIRPELEQLPDRPQLEDQYSPRSFDARELSDREVEWVSRNGQRRVHNGEDLSGETIASESAKRSKRIRGRNRTKVKDYNKEVKAVEARNQAARDDMANVRMDAYGRIRSNRNELIAKRIDDIKRAARELNDGQEILYRKQMIALGITLDELSKLGLDYMVPAPVRYDGLPDDSEVASGNAPYQTYLRLDDDNQKDDAIKRLSALRDQEVAEMTNVLIPEEEEIDESHETFQGLANGVAPTELESRDDYLIRIRQSKLSTQMAWLNPIRVFSNLFTAKTIKDRGFDFAMATMDKRVVNAIDNVSVAYHGLSINSCLSLVMARGGIGYDNFNKMKPEIRNDTIIELCMDIIESMKINGLPNNMVKGKAWSRGVRDDYGNVVLGGTRCFPFGYIPADVIREIRSIEGSPLSDMTMEQIRKMEYEQFMNFTLPAIMENADKPQIESYRTGMAALLELDGYDSRFFDIPHDTAMTVMQRMEDLKGIDDPAVNMAAIVNNKDIMEAAERTEAKYRHTPHTRYAAKDGSRRGGKIKSLISETNPLNVIDNGTRTLSNYTRTMGALNLGSMMSAIPENALSEIETMEANAIEQVMMNRLDKLGVDTDLYRPTDYIVGMVRSDKALETMQVMDTLYHLDGMGWNIVAMYKKRNYQLNKSDLSKFINDIRGMNDGSIADFNAFVSNAEHFFAKFLSGDGMFQRRDMQEWITTTLQMMAEHKARGIGAGVFTASQMEEAIQKGGIEQFISDMMFDSEVARDAYMFMGLNSFGSKNPFSHAAERMFKINGISQFVFGMFIDQFPTYGTNVIIKHIPFSNTLSYITSTLVAAGGIATGVDQIKNIKNYQAGLRTVFDRNGNMDMRGFYDGLRRNLIYDCVHLKNKILMTCIIYSMIDKMGGLGVPDDEKNKYMMEEYRIGGKDGVPRKYAWWLDDILGISVGAAIALYLHDNGAYDRAGNHVDIDNETATSVLWYAATHLTNGTAIVDAIDMIGNLDENMDTLFIMLADPEGYADSIESADRAVPADLGELSTAFFEHYFLANTLRNSMPRLFNQLFPLNKGFILRDPNGDAHTAWSKWDTRPTSRNPEGKSKEEAMSTLDTTGVGFLEGMRRNDSQDNFLYGIYNDIFRLHWSPIDILNGGINRDETGYLYEEQALGTKTDDASMLFMKQFDFDPLHDDEGNTFTNQDDLRGHLNEHAVMLIDTLEELWGEGNEYNVQRAIADGLVIPYQARINAVEYCYYMYNQVKDRWQAMDDDSEEYWDYYYDHVKPAKEKYIDGYVKGWHLDYGDNTIPSVAPKYVKLESDYLTRYINENGEAASMSDFLSGNANKEVYAYGNPRSELTPVSSPRTDGMGFNYELPPYWDVPGYTDYQGIADRLHGNSVNYGLNANQDLEQVYFGGQPDQSLKIPTDGSMQTTINLRNYRKSDMTELPKILRNDPTAESIHNLLGLTEINTPTEDDKDDSTTNSNGNSGGSGSRGSYGRRSYGGSRSYYYGGGGGGGYSSSYNPRIYSSARQVNGGRASGLSIRQPYKATSTYLRPAFYTKGSREAYKRQDI